MVPKNKTIHIPTFMFFGLSQLISSIITYLLKEKFQTIPNVIRVFMVKIFCQIILFALTYEKSYIFFTLLIIVEICNYLIELIIYLMIYNQLHSSKIHLLYINEIFYVFGYLLGALFKNSYSRILNVDDTGPELICSINIHDIEILDVYKFFLPFIQMITVISLYYWKKQEIIDNKVKNNNLNEYEDIPSSYDEKPYQSTLIIYTLLMVFSQYCIKSSLYYFIYYCNKNWDYLSNLTFLLFFMIISKILSMYLFISKHQLFTLTASISICSMASCLFNFPIPLNLVYILYGIGIGPIFPTILGYLKLSNVDKIHFIFISKALANLLSPIVINEIINKYGKKIYSSFAFLSSLAYILFFVGILNYHASKSYDDLTDGKYKIWYLFFGSKTDTAKRKVRKVMRSFRNKSFKAITTVRYHARTWSSRRVKNISQGRGRKLRRNNKRNKTLEVPSSTSIEECDISNSDGNKKELNSNNNSTLTVSHIHV